MASPNVISFLDPSTVTDQAELDRRMQLAQMLQAQSMKPIEAQQGMRVQPKINPLQGIAQIAQALMAGKMNEDNTQARGALAQKSMNALVQALGGSQTPASAQGDYGPGEAPSVLPSQLQTGTPAMGATTNGGNQFNIQNALKVGAMGQLSPEMAGVMAKEYATPDAVKTMDLTGQNRQDMGRLGRAAEMKKGIIEFNPGTTSKDLATGQERFQPKVGEGVVLGPQGASELPNYGTTAAGIAGATAQATEGAKMMDVPVGNGKTMKMTQAQYLAIQQGKPGQPDLPSPQMQGMDNAKLPIAASGMPGQPANLSGNLGQIGISADPSEQAGRTELSKAMATEAVNNLKDSYGKVNGAQQIAPSVDALKTAINSGKLITGTLSGARLTAAQIGSTLGYKGGDEALAQTQNAIKSMASFALGARGQLKGSGAISDFEQKTLNKASSGDLSFTIPELKALVSVTERGQRASYENHNEMMGKLPDDPSINAFKKMYTIDMPTPQRRQSDKTTVIDFNSLPK